MNLRKPRLRNTLDRLREKHILSLQIYVKKKINKPISSKHKWVQEMYREKKNRLTYKRHKYINENSLNFHYKQKSQTKMAE